MPIRKEIRFNQEFWWSIDECLLMSKKINFLFKKIDSEMKNGSNVFAQTSILIGDVFVYKPVDSTVWLTITDPDQVKSYFLVVLIKS
jgi:hypothetical protein